MSHAPTPEEKKAAELEMAADGAMMCLAARDHVEKLTDTELTLAVEKQIWAKLGFGGQEDWLLDELINRFEIRRGIMRDGEGNPVPNGLDALAERIASSMWGYFEGGSAGSADAVRYFEYHKRGGGPKHVIERVREQLRASFNR